VSLGISDSSVIIFVWKIAAAVSDKAVICRRVTRAEVPDRLRFVGHSLGRG
jgi:hypothetical protein